jgi:hypothetical protein
VLRILFVAVSTLVFLGVPTAADGKAWLCFVSGTMVPTELAIRAARARLQAGATALGGEYDGWEAAVSS